ncbi:mature-parasite-infected erythrocyte surface antigen, putative [Babesia caballi]|uniref:Mature-parasite-infected erythrocyte surface antigen, putative n=1 Tax=Babesia caballi TaxID=5871 RepID=A0AAV4LUV2_BABCB|nr:mature-parasite-infected erythrocyte surface antigen, putative [Babesia caballi]
MATQESMSATDNLFKDDDDLDVSDAGEQGAPMASKPAETVASQWDGDIEKWFMENLLSIIPKEMQARYINKNNLLFAFQRNPLEDREEDHKREWLKRLTNGGRRTILNSFDIVSPFTKIPTTTNEAARRRVAIDYKSDPSFLRIIDKRTGRYILANLAKVATEQRRGLIKYVEYLRENIRFIPLMEELNRFALVQKLAYTAARKEMWFFLALAEELKLVKRSKSHAYKVAFPNEKMSEPNPYVLDRHVTAKWLYGKNDRMKTHVAPDAEAPRVSECGDNALGERDVLLSERGLTEGPLLNTPHKDGDSFLGGRLLDSSQDANLSHAQLPDSMGMADSGGTALSHFTDASASNWLPGDESLGISGYPMSFHGSISGESGYMYGVQRRKKPKVATTETEDSLQGVVNRMNNRTARNAGKNAIHTIAVLEATGKFYGHGPKWSNPDKSEFDKGNKKNALVYVRPPKTLSKSSIAYEYLMQYKSVHQKLNGGIRQQHAVSYGIITLGTAAPGEPISSYQVNAEPWNDPGYAEKWKKLEPYSGKFPPWRIPGHQPPANSGGPNVQEDLDKTNTDNLSRSGKEPSNPPMPSDASMPTESNGSERSQNVCITDSTSDLAAPVAARNIPSNQAQEMDKVQEHQHQYGDSSVDGGFSSQKDRQMEAGAGTAVPGGQHVEGCTAAPTGAEGHIEGEERCFGGAKGDTVSQELNATENPAEAESEKHLHTQVDDDGNTEGPNLPIDSGMKQMKLTSLFRYVYTKMKKVKSLPECSPELLVRPKKLISNRILEEDHTLNAQVSGKRKRILDDDFIPEAFTVNYVKINTSSSPRKESPIDVDTVAEEKGVDAEQNVGFSGEAKQHKKERIRKMRELVKNMFEVEAEESEDENLSDPEDIRKKLQLLKERLQHSSGESESDDESDTDVADEMKDFITDVDKLNAEDEEIAKQRFQADMKQMEENELAKLMPLKERSERELTRREQRMKLLMQLRKAKNVQDIQDLHPSDFESSEEENGESVVQGKTKRRITKAELEKLMKFKKGDHPFGTNVSEVEELRLFVDAKLQTYKKYTDEAPIVKNLVERVSNERREMMDNMLASGFDSDIFGDDLWKPFGNTNPFGNGLNPRSRESAGETGRSPRNASAIVMKSFRLNQSVMKPLNSTNIRNVGGFTGFHNLESALRESQNPKRVYGSNKANARDKP